REPSEVVEHACPPSVDRGVPPQLCKRCPYHRCREGVGCKGNAVTAEKKGDGQARGVGRDALLRQRKPGERGKPGGPFRGAKECSWYRQGGLFPGPAAPAPGGPSRRAGRAQGQ